jgi:hypothetical protein
VGRLIVLQCGVEAVRNAGKYLPRSALTAQKPIRLTYEQDPAAVRRWLRRNYPAIVALARQTRGTIFWGDETALARMTCAVAATPRAAGHRSFRFATGEHA